MKKNVKEGALKQLQWVREEANQKAEVGCDCSKGENIATV